MTKNINKSPDQTLTKVGSYPLQSVFTHGQLYVAMSKVKSYNGKQFALALPPENSMAMTNYKYVTDTWYLSLGLDVDLDWIRISISS